MKGHFFYSKKREQALFRNRNDSRRIQFKNYAKIDGVEVRYNIWQMCEEGTKPDHGTLFEDAAYLGFGEYHRSGGRI